MATKPVALSVEVSSPSEGLRPKGKETPVPTPLSRAPSRENTTLGDPTVITDTARSIITKLRDEIPDLRSTSPLYIRFDDAYLNRFVRARQHKYHEVKIMVEHHIRWLRDFNVANIMDFQFHELDQFRLVYPHGYHGTDKLGRPIYIERYSKLNADYLNKITTMERISKYWVRGYEQLLFHRFPTCRPGVCQTTVILDLSGIRLGMFDSRAREFLKTVSKVSSDNYPETLGAMFIVNVPSFFSVLYNVAKPLIPPETKRKIHVLTSKNVKAELLKFIDSDQLPNFLGGECICDPSSTTDDKGCLYSNKGPWKDLMAENCDMDEFVSCVGDQNDPRAFSVEHFHTPNISRLPSMTINQTRKRWTFFRCCSKKSLN